MKRYLLVIVVALVSLGIFWLPLLLKTSNFWGIDFGRHGMETIVQNFDGLNYLAVAKTLYDPELLTQRFAGLANEPIYYAAHFPGYPLLIKAFDTVMSGPAALLSSIIISNILLAIGLYYFFSVMAKNKSMAIYLTGLALFLPARMLSVRTVGASEPLFMFFVLTSLAMAYRSKHLLGAIFGTLAVLTRSTGIFLFGAYCLAALLTYKQDGPKALRMYWPYLIMPLGLVTLFGVYQLRLGSFWAYFNSGSELHPVFFPPFLVFSNMQKWVSDMWREDIFYTYLLYGVGIVGYLKQSVTKMEFGKIVTPIYGVVYGILLLLVSHRDLGRYALPLAPIAILGIQDFLSAKTLKWMLILLLPIYLLGWQFVVANIQPVADWTQLL